MKPRFVIQIATLFLAMAGSFLGGHAQKAVDLSGEWKGNAVETTSGSKSYVYNIKVEQNGNRLKGTSFTCEKDRPYFYAIMKFEAVLDGKRLGFKETQILEYKIEPNWDWCLQYGYLTLDTTGKDWILSGTLGGNTEEGTPCVSAKITLKKPAPPRPVVKNTPPVVKNTPPVVKNQNQTKPDSTVKNTPPVVKKDTVIVQNNPKPEVPEKREIEKQNSVSVSSNLAKIYVWDADALDGDSIQVSLNGKVILDNYKLTGAKKEIPVKLEPGSNMVVLHAINLGRIPPNTAAISVYDGKNWHSLKLSSDMNTSGALEIQVSP